jgi:hypothetical protein
MAESTNGFVRFVRSPTFLMLTGAILCITSGYEVFGEFEELMSGESDVGAHHGVFVVGILHALHGVAEMMEGSAVAGEGVE